MSSSHGQEDPAYPSDDSAGYSPEGYETSESYEAQAGYDPGSALVEENQSYGAAEYPDPNQAYYDEEGRWGALEFHQDDEAFLDKELLPLLNGSPSRLRLEELLVPLLRRVTRPPIDEET